MAEGPATPEAGRRPAPEAGFGPGAASVLWGLCAGLGSLLAYGAWVFAAVGPDAILDPEAPLGLDPSFRFDAILCLQIGYAAAAAVWSRRATRGDLASLAPVLLPEATPLRAHISAAPGWRRILPGIAAGLFVAGSLSLAAEVVARAGDAPGQLAARFVLMALEFGLLGVLAAETLAASFDWLRLGRDHVRVSLLDPAPLHVFARRGVRVAAIWFLGSALASLLFLDAEEPLLVAGVLPATLAVGGAALCVTWWGVHERIAEHRRRELLWVRDALARERGALGRGEPAPALPSLLAWETRVREVSTWPIDVGSRVRFLVFLLIPLGSWLGGALVERVLGWWLD